MSFIKLRSAIYGLLCVSKVRGEPVYSKKKTQKQKPTPSPQPPPQQQLLVFKKEKILHFITWLVFVGAAGLEEIKSNKIGLCL